MVQIVSNMTAGATIKAGGRDWTLLNPSTGLSLLKGYATSRALDSNNYPVVDVNNSNNLGYYLKNEFLNSLITNGLKIEWLQNKVFYNWYENSETSSGYNAEIGLLRKSEFETYKQIIPNDLSKTFWWLQTPSTEVENASWVVLTSAGHYVGDSQANHTGGGVRPVVYFTTSLKVDENGNVIINRNPSINVISPTTNQTLHENSTFSMVGSATELDIDDVVTIKYQIDSGTVRNLHSAVSDGSSPIDFNKSLTYKDGVLKDGATTVTSTLDKDVPHTVSMWAEDGKGGKSNIITRSFFVVPNRAPQVTISPITQRSELINSDVINVSGAVVDLDHNDVTVTFAINSGEEQQVYVGPPSAFTFNILLANLKTGTNTVIVKATDTYNMSGTKTLTIHKTHDAVPVNTAVARYQIVAPTGSAQSILLWVTRTLGNLGINAAVSLTNANEAENYVDLTPTNTGVVNGNREDEFAYQGTVSKEKIILKITYNRTDANVIDTIKQISGVLF